MTETPEFDWQHPDVVERLAVDLIDATDSWREEHGIGALAGQYVHDMILAIQYAGLTLDGYQMARFLEDSRSWPSDTKLVIKLSQAADRRGFIILQLKREHAPKPATIQEPVVGDSILSSDKSEWICRQIAGTAPNRRYEFECVSHHHRGAKSTVEEQGFRNRWPELWKERPAPADLF